MIRPWRLRRLALLAGAALVLLAAAVSQAGEVRAPAEKTVIELFDGSELVFCGKVQDVELPAGQRVCLGRVLPSCAIKGEPEKAGLLVAQDLFFPSDLPSFHPGRDALLFLTALPSDSRWNGYRSRGVRHMASGGGQGIREMGPDSLKETAEFLRRYGELSPARDEEGRMAYFEFLLEALVRGPTTEIVEAAAGALGGDAGLFSMLKTEHGRDLGRFVLDRRKSRKARARLLESAARAGGFEGEISRILREEPEMRAQTLAALALSPDRDPARLAGLEACLEDRDPHVREKALGILAESDGDQVDLLVGKVARRDASPEVRARAMSILGTRGGDEGRPVLVQGLEDASPLVVHAAAEALVRSSGEGAVRDVGRLLHVQNAKSRTVGILVLGSLEYESARAMLRRAAQAHADPGVRDLCKKVLEAGPPRGGTLEEWLGTD